MSLTVTQTGQVLTETMEGITMPADYSFTTVNDYVHGVDVNFEDLQALCLGMATENDNLRAENTALKNWKNNAIVQIAKVDSPNLKD